MARGHRRGAALVGLPWPRSVGLGIGKPARAVAFMCESAAQSALSGTGAVCKTVGLAYVGSNPTPATTCENGPLAAETRPTGPFPSCHAMYHDASLWVDAWQCARTYGVQRPGKTSGAYNRSLCRSTPVLSLSRAPGCSSE